MDACRLSGPKGTIGRLQGEEVLYPICHRGRDLLRDFKVTQNKSVVVLANPNFDEDLGARQKNPSDSQPVPA